MVLFMPVDQRTGESRSAGPDRFISARACLSAAIEFYRFLSQLSSERLPCMLPGNSTTNLTQPDHRLLLPTFSPERNLPPCLFLSGRFLLCALAPRICDGSLLRPWHLWPSSPSLADL